MLGTSTTPTQSGVANTKHHGQGSNASLGNCIKTKCRTNCSPMGQEHVTRTGCNGTHRHPNVVHRTSSQHIAVLDPGTTVASTRLHTICMTSNRRLSFRRRRIVLTTTGILVTSVEIPPSPAVSVPSIVRRAADESLPGLAGHSQKPSRKAGPRESKRIMYLASGVSFSAGLCTAFSSTMRAGVQPLVSSAISRLPSSSST